MFYINYPSPVGMLLIAANQQGLAGIYFEEHKHFKGCQGWHEQADHPVLQQARHQLAEYFAGQRQDFDLPLDCSAGTAFQQTVWQALRRIPYGTTVSYGELAKQIQHPAAVRAVGAANGRNPISIIIPCHRVIAGNGALTGYAGGVQNKQRLLALEEASLFA